MKTNKFILFFFLIFIRLLVHAQNKPQQTTGTVYVNLNQTIRGANYIDIPFSFFSTDSIVSLDFAVKFNESVLSYQSLVYTAPYLTDALATYALDDKTLRFTSNSPTYYKINQKIVTVRFNLLTNSVSASDIFGLVGYLNGDRVNMQLQGEFPFRNYALKFWFDNSPIQYAINDPDNYLITNIYGVDSNCSNKSVPVQPDLNGQFNYAFTNGSSIQIQRDILTSTNVQPVINGFDVSLGHKVLVNDLSFIPSIYQVIALDVNSDGVISAGDISQINQRSVKTIPEFRQKWNYNNTGNSNGQLSKDWLFINSAALTDPAYQVSATYPFDDNVGYSKTNVPIVRFCLEVPTANNASFTGIFLGDVNGNYANVSNDGKIKRGTRSK